MNKDAIAKVIWESNNKLSKNESRRIVDLVFNEISDSLKSGKDVSIYGFGKFETKERLERNGFNPSTREIMTISPLTIPSFRAYKSLKDKVK